MNHHERCLSTIEGRPVDRAPRYCPGVACDVISKILGREAHGGTGSLRFAESCAILEGESAHGEFVEQLFEDIADFNRIFDIDVFRIPWRQTERPSRRVDEYTFVFGDPDGNHRVDKYDPTSGEFGCVKTVATSPLSPEDALKEAVEKAERAIENRELENLSLPKDHLYVLEKYGDEFFVVCNGGYIAVGMEADDLVLLLTETDLVKRKVMAQAHHNISFAQCLARSSGPNVLIGGGDMAGNDGPFYSPDCFRDVMLPPLKLLVSGMEKADVHYVFRSDGDLWPVADMLFGEAGCSGYGEVDRLTKMTVGALREHFPKLVLWGNMASQKLQEEAPEWIRADAQACIEESGGTGYFHGPSNAILRGTSVEAVEAMFSA